MKRTTPKKTTRTTTLAPSTPPANPAALAIRKQQLTGAREGFIALTDFSVNLEAFFDKAGHLIARADESLAQAKAFTAPKTAVEDERIQVEAKRVNADIKETEGHFDTITGPLTKLHKFFTGYRGRGIKALEEAKTIVNSLHNTYTRAEELRVQQENDRRRRAAEEKAAKERQDELDALEAAALKAEAKSPDLSERETRFVRMVTGGTASTNAAKAAGYANPFDMAARLMSSPKIQKAIKAISDAARLRQQATEAAQEPVGEAEYVPTTANVVKAAGAKDVTRWKAIIDDPGLLREAVITGEFGIPHDVLMPDPVKLNDYARSMQRLIDKWPGVHAADDTRVQ